MRICDADGKAIINQYAYVGLSPGEEDEKLKSETARLHGLRYAGAEVRDNPLPGADPGAEI